LIQNQIPELLNLIIIDLKSMYGTLVPYLILSMFEITHAFSLTNLASNILFFTAIEVVKLKQNY
jgi:hypothetical protein